MGKNIIFYFTGTGNSLFVARKIAATLGDCELVSMAKSYQLTKEYDRIGFVFPVFVEGLPRLVKRFLAETDFPASKNAYYFAVPTYGGTRGNALADVNQLLQSQNLILHGGFGVKMFSNYVVLYPMKKDGEQIRLQSNQAILEVTARIVNREKTKIPRANSIFRFANKQAMKHFPVMDKDYGVSAACTVCGICAKICPTCNIQIEDAHPCFHQSCEQCMACIQWCPKQAINYKTKTQTRGRYHHPDIALEDMVKAVQ